MDELIVRVMRTVACATRLRVLSCLAGVPELLRQRRPTFADRPPVCMPRAGRHGGLRR